LDDAELDMLTALTLKAHGQPVGAPLDLSRLSEAMRAEMQALAHQREGLWREQRETEARLRADVTRLEAQLHTALIAGDLPRHRLAATTAAASAPEAVSAGHVAADANERTSDLPIEPEQPESNVLPFPNEGPRIALPDDGRDSWGGGASRLDHHG